MSSQAYAYQLLVLSDTKQPIPGATILVGYSENNPFPDNMVRTNGQGIAEVPDLWAKDLPLTVLAEGFLKTSFQNLSSIGLNLLVVNRAELRPSFEVKGDTKNFENLKRDGKVDFALVYPAFRKSQLSRFDVNSVMSSEVDVIRVSVKEVAVPSNVTLPEQNESYILPITLDKPTYRLGFRLKGEQRMVATRGQFPLKQVVDELRDGKSFFDVIKYFRFLGAGERQMNIQGPMTGQDISVNEIVFDARTNTKAPDSLPADTTMLSFSVVERAGTYSATDIKQLAAGQSAELVLPSRVENNELLSLLLSSSEIEKFRAKKSGVEGLRERRMRNPENELSRTVVMDPLSTLLFMLQNFAPSLRLNSLEPTELKVSGVSIAQHAKGLPTPEFLNLITKPSFENGVVEVEPPALRAGIDPIATRVAVYELEETRQEDRKVTQSYRVWEGTYIGWIQEITIPAAGLTMDPAKKYKIEVFFTGRMTNQKNNGEYILDDVTHVTRNSLYL